MDDTTGASVSRHRLVSRFVSVPRTLLVLLFVVVSTRVAEVPQQYASSQAGGWWDEQPATPLPTEELADIGAAAARAAEPAPISGETADEAPPALVARPGAERMRRVPVREPAALPSDALPPVAPETRRPTAAPAGEPAPGVDAASAEPLAEAAAPPAAPPMASSAVESRTGTVAANAETVYYEVEGLSRSEISAALRAHGPSVRGQQFFGLTEWEMSAGYLPAKIEGGCAVDDLTVRVSTTTHLPQWPSDAVASEALREAWDRFVMALTHHEHGHRVLAEQAAEVVRQRLLTVSAPTCAALDGMARGAMADVMREYEARQHAYDADTEHGRTQGAVWPPRR